jgi:uncharacterized membrane protein
MDEVPVSFDMPSSRTVNLTGTVLKGCNSKDVIISANEKGWMNSEVMKFWLENVWRKRKTAFFNLKSLLMSDSCRAHITPEIKTIVNKYSKMAVSPGGFNQKLQPLDITVNKPFKDQLRAKREN